MRGTAVVDRRVVALLLAACLAAIGLSVTTAPAARADASTLYTLLNQSRQAAGLPQLVRDSRLDAVAQTWTASMASTKTLGHNPSYSTQIPSGWTKAGENVAGGYATDAATHQAWMNSAGHKANILGAYTSVGIGWVKAADGGIWATQVFATYRGVTPPSSGSTTLTDVTGDAKTDLVGVNSSGRLVMVPGNGAGGLKTSVVLGSGWSGMRDLLPVSDATRDGVSDLYARDSAGKLLLYPGVRGGGLGTGVVRGTGWSGMTALADLDGNRDGISDLFARDADGRFWFYRGTGAGALGARTLAGSGWSSMSGLVSPGDVTRDGVPDLFARDRSAVLWLYPGNGSGGFLPRVKVGGGWGGLTLVAPGDLTGDQVGDLVARTTSGALVLYAGNGSGGVLAGRQLGSSWSGLAKLG